jgi:hypothetical protein
MKSFLTFLKEGDLLIRLKSIVDSCKPQEVVLLSGQKVNVSPEEASQLLDKYKYTKDNVKRDDFERNMSKDVAGFMAALN